MDIELTRGYGKAWTESITTVLPEIMMLLRQDVAKWFAYTINFGVKHVIDHQTDFLRMSFSLIRKICWCIRPIKLPPQTSSTSIDDELWIS